MAADLWALIRNYGDGSPQHPCIKLFDVWAAKQVKRLWQISNIAVRIVRKHRIIEISVLYRNERFVGKVKYQKKQQLNGILDHVRIIAKAGAVDTIMSI